jgi:Taurine catabolism dioxygenase TauD, TfdA family
MSVHTKTRVTVTPAGGAAGATVTGVDLSKPNDTEEIAAVRKALLDHLVVALPDQTLSLDDLERFTDALGGRDITPFVAAVEGRPHVIRILKEPNDKLNFANAWHTDLSYLEAPPSFTILYCLETPPVGGDTVWANQYLAFETLSAGLRDTLLGLNAVHSAGPAYGTGGYLDTVKHQLSTKIERRLQGTDAPRRHRSCRNRQGGALRQSGLHAAHRWLVEGGVGCPARPHPSPCGEREFHLAAQMGEGNARDLGQSLHPAYRAQRLPGPAAGDAPHHGGRRQADVRG